MKAAWNHGLWRVAITMGVCAILAMAARAAIGQAARADTAQSSGIASVDDHYTVKWNGISVGDLRIQIEPQAGESGCYVGRATTQPNLIADKVYGAPRQVSVFCVVDGSIHTRSYRYELPGHPDRDYSLTFNWRNHTVTDNEGHVRHIPDNAVDSFTLQQAVRLWLRAHAADADPPDANFTLVDRKNLTHYRLKRVGRQTIDTPAGRFNTWLMERIDNPDKVGKYWIAPEREYLPVASETRNGMASVLTTMLAR
ncbi:MAG TPA: DUF3108 domain-containing protein [Nevskiaceae bacterium]